MNLRAFLFSGMWLVACAEPPLQPALTPPAPAAPRPPRVSPPPDFDLSTPQLPRLSGDVVVDGKTDDFRGAVSVPLRARSQMIQVAPGRQWRGLADLSADAYVGWTGRGIAIAVVVRDDDVGNHRSDAELYQEDCVELFIDGRPGSELRKAEYGTGTYQIFVPAPVEGQPAHVFVAHDAKIEGLGVAAVRTAGGYTVEVLLPWSAFPGLVAGPKSRVGLAFQVDEHDERDGDGRSITLAAPISPDLWQSPALFEPWQLVDQVIPGGALGPQLLLDGRRVFDTQPPMQVVAHLGATLGERVRKVRLRAPFLIATAPVIAGSARLDVPPAAWPLGRVTLEVEAIDAEGELVGKSSFPVMNLGRTIAESLGALRGADLLTQPFRGAAWLGAASALERLREAFAAEDAAAVDRRMREVRGRVALLEGRPAELGRADFHDLLVLGTDPEAEVAIEYPSPVLATVTFLYGSIPLGSVRVSPNPGAGLPEWTSPLEHPTVAGKRAVFTDIWVYQERMDPSAIDPARDLFIWQPGKRELWAIGPGDLGRTAVDCRLHLGAGPKVTTSLPSASLEQAATCRAVLVVGDPRRTPELGRARLSRVFPRVGAARMALGADGRLLEAVAPSREAAELVLGYVLAQKPVTLADLEALRRAVIRAVAPLVKPAPARFWCGDLHMHSFYSDGTPSPTALLLEAMYTEQDFSVLTDHDTLAGIRRLRDLLARNGFAYPAIVGEEYTTFFHSVIFPLTTAIVPGPKPDARELARQVHSLGAFLQWNHPHFTSWGREYWATGGEKVGFDAWEHLPPRLDLWTRQGKLPLITGSTDSHDGTFGNLPERTLVFADSADGAVLAEALRQKRAVAILPEGGKLFYGPAGMVRRAQAALVDGTSLRAARADRLRQTLARARLADLVAASETGPIP